MSDKLSDNFRTPTKGFWDVLNKVTPFFLDACCDRNNCLVKEHKAYLAQGRGVDYLTQNVWADIRSGRINWRKHTRDSIFINPPYSNVRPFIEKAWGQWINISQEWAYISFNAGRARPTRCMNR